MNNKTKLNWQVKKTRKPESQEREEGKDNLELGEIRRSNGNLTQIKVNCADLVFLKRMNVSKGRLPDILVNQAATAA